MDPYGSHVGWLYDEEYASGRYHGLYENMEYAFKYDDVIKQTKREVAKLRRAKKHGEVSKELEKLELDNEDMVEDINIIEHYPIYLAMFSLLYKSGKSDASIFYPTLDCLEKYRQDQITNGYRKAYLTFMTTLTVGEISTDSSSWLPGSNMSSFSVTPWN